MYYNPYPNSYAPYQNQMMPNQPQQQQNQPYAIQQPSSMPASSSITWVQGEVGARAYPVAAGSSVMLMDSDDKYFYIKSADNMGMPALRKYYYSEVVEEPTKQIEHNHSYDTENLVNKDELEKLQDEIYELKQTIQELKAHQQPTTTSSQVKGRKQA